MAGLPVFLGVLEAVLNRYLRLDPNAVAALAGLAGEGIAIELLDWGQTIYVDITAEGVHLTRTLERAPDAWVRGTPAALAHQLISRDASERLFDGDVTIEGDLGLVQEFREILAGMDVDWEEQLSHAMGDPAAHQLGNLFRDAARWRRDALQTLSDDIAEYLLEEARLLAHPGEVAGFLASVDTLRDDVERLEKRLDRLAERYPEGGP